MKIIALLLALNAIDYSSGRSDVTVASIDYSAGRQKLEEKNIELPVAKADGRPLVTLYSTPGCAPCEKAKRLVEAGIMPEVRFSIVRDKPDWAEATPILHYENADGESRIFRLYQYEPSLGFAEFRKAVLPHLSSKTNIGQSPTPIAEVRRVLALLHPQSNETFVDYGCGDGRWLIEAARTYGCRAIGVEIDPQQVDRARRAADQEGLVGRVQIIEGDVLTANVEAQVGVAYLYPDLLAKLKPRLLKLDRFATPFHAIDGLQMQQHGDAWVWRKPQAVQQQQPYAVYGGQVYTGRVCNNPRCQMCNAIQQQIQSQQSSRRMVLRYVPCATCPSGYRLAWTWE